MSPALPILAQFAQMLSVVLLSVLFWPIVRVIRERYLVFWAWGWALLAGGLVALFFSVYYPTAAVPLRVVYCVGSYGFGFLLWVGSREYATARSVRPADLLWLLPPLAFGVCGPLFLTSLPHLFGGHAAVMACHFAAALWHTRRFHSQPQSVTGRWLYQGGLFALALLFAHYVVLLLYLLASHEPPARFPYMALSSLYDLAAQAVLALGMVSIATERMRAELEEKNRRLRAAAAELEQAARTDPLTGLLNRRGLAELLARTNGLPAGCVASLDVNDLKPVNDRHGHAAGDVVLQLVARGLRTLFRVTDPILRLGGDEFAVVMPGGSAAEMSERLQQLDAVLRNQRLPGVDGPLDVRVAWGVAVYGTASEVTPALARADEAMYGQKRQRKGP